MNGTGSEVVALVPAAGHATRLGALPGSKEALIVERPGGRGQGLVCEDLLDACALAGVDNALLLTRRKKLDLPRSLERARRPAPRIVTLVVPPTPSPVHTLAHASDLVRRRTVALGFPDILLEPLDCLARLLAFASSHDAPLSLALFPTREPERSDTVEVEPSGRVRRIAVKEAGSALPWMWILATWEPPVTEALAAAARRQPEAPLHVGDVLQELVTGGMSARALALPDGRAVDLGTPAALRQHRLQPGG